MATHVIPPVWAVPSVWISTHWEDSV